MSSSRQFDIVLLGATGYTGKLCAEHITRYHQMNLKWAIAGRSQIKLEGVADNLRKINADRVPPEIAIAQLNAMDLDALARKAKVLINCVGPYHLYSTPVVEACANNGTHYLDVTGEMVWIKEMIDKYHEEAKSTGAIIIPADGVESAPADILTWALVKFIRDKFSVSTNEVINSIYELKAAGASGGTLNTVVTILDSYPTSEFAKARDPHYLCNSKPTSTAPTPLLHQLIGAHYVPDLGTVTTTPPAICDTLVVHRSSSLMPQLYGPKFRFWEYANVRNSLLGVFVHFAIIAGAIALSFSPVRWLMRKVIYAPGDGPSPESTVGNSIEYRAIATAEHKEPEGKPIRVLGTYKYEGCPYTLTGLLLGEAAMVLLKSKTVQKEAGGGLLTPAVLGQEYVDRIRKVGVSIETKVLEA